MEILIVNQTDVPALLPMGECVDVMAEALAGLARGEVLMPLRSVMWLPERVGALGMMPAYAGDRNVMGLKVISVFPGNHGTEFDSHQGAIMLFETQNGRPLAIVDATSVTAIRTAAVSGVATRLLAREDAGDLAILGSGTQARAHLDAMRLVRSIRHVRVWSRNPEHAAAFARREGERYGMTIETSATAQRAVDRADLICTTTSSAEPVLKGEWIAPGAHINAVGSSVPFARELDTTAVVRSRLFVDRRESTTNEAGDFLFPKKEGAIGDDHIRGEIGQVLIGRVPGRRSADEITLFKSLGLAIEDVASAHHIYTKALESGRGLRIALGGGRHT
jgi:ornithine cyclodeaminase